MLLRPRPGRISSDSTNLDRHHTDAIQPSKTPYSATVAMSRQRRSWASVDQAPIITTVRLSAAQGASGGNSSAIPAVTSTIPTVILNQAGYPQAMKAAVQ